MINRCLIYIILLLMPLSYLCATELPPGIIKLSPFTAPAIKLTDIDEEPFNLNDSKGHWVFVHFWASWCGPCRKEMPAIQNMWQKMKNKGMKIALINTAENEDTIFSFLSIYAPDIRPLMDKDGQVTEEWKPRGLPATYLVDPQGRVQYQALGGRRWDQPPYTDFLTNLIKKSSMDYHRSMPR